MSLCHPYGAGIECTCNSRGSPVHCLPIPENVSEMTLADGTTSTHSDEKLTGGSRRKNKTFFNEIQSNKLTVNQVRNHPISHLTKERPCQYLQDVQEKKNYQEKHLFYMLQDYRQILKTNIVT